MNWAPSSRENNTRLTWIIFSYKAVWDLVILSYIYHIPMPPISKSKYNFSPIISALQAVVIVREVGACVKAWREQLNRCEPCWSWKVKDWSLSTIHLSWTELITPSETQRLGARGREGEVSFASCRHGNPQVQLLPSGSCDTVISLIHPSPPFKQQNICLKRNKPCRWVG